MALLLEPQNQAGPEQVSRPETGTLDLGRPTAPRATPQNKESEREPVWWEAIVENADSTVRRRQVTKGD